MQSPETVTLTKAEHEAQQARVATLEARKQELEARNVDLKFQLDQLKRLLFGRKSERFVPEGPSNAQQLMLAFGDEETAGQLNRTVRQIVEAHERRHPEKIKEQEHKGRMAIPDNIERREEIVEPEEDVSDMVRIGEDVTEILEIEEPKLYVRRIVRPRYARKNEVEGKPTIVQAPANEPLGRSKAGVSLIAWILTLKYVEHLPLHRIIQRLARCGLKVPEATIGHWAKTGMDMLSVLYQFYEGMIFRTSYLQMDETTIRVLEDGKGKCHLGYYWVVFDPITRLPFYYYHPGRDQAAPKKLLANFKGALQCDGYAVYTQLKKQGMPLTLVNCMAHIRREFFDAQANDEKRAREALSLIKLLYTVEEKARNLQLTTQQRLELRLEESKPVFDLLKSWLDQNYMQVTPASPIGKAIAYALQRWGNMLPIFENGAIEIDNNLVENAIRPTALGRKNYLFAGSHEAAQRAAMIYTFFAACKQHQINPEHWLKDVLGRIQDTSILRIETLFPHNWKPA